MEALKLAPMKIDLETPLREITFAAFDLETTGMDPVRDKILEVGIAIFKGNRIQSCLEFLVNPGIPIPKVALDIHGIDDSMVRDSPKLETILPEILSTLAQAVPLAHNASFDLSFLVEVARCADLPLFSSPVVDTCLLSRHLFPKLPSHKLQSLVVQFNLGADQSHRALSDAKSCFSLFVRAVEELPLKWETSWGAFRSMFSGVLSIDLDRSNLPEKFSSFHGAIAERRRLVLSYQDGKGKVTQREVTPMGFALDERKRQVMFGYCHLRQGTRTFRIDRILEIKVS
jgi:DNA polymerase III epsilon subunit family exonuclease